LRSRELGPLEWALLAALLLFQCRLLLPESLLHPVPLNDDAMHMAASLEARDLWRQATPKILDTWFPYWSLGYPIWHAYQPLSHLATGLMAAPLSDAAFPALYGFVKLALLLLFPFSVLAGARRMGFPAGTCVAAALVSPLVATQGLYGLEYGSYLWRGSGLYSQLWAMDLLPLAVGFGVAALRGRARWPVPALLLALTFLAHAIFGYVAGMSLLVAAIVVRRERGGVVPFGRLARILLPAGLLAAFFIVPLLADASWINHSRWESAWKWDSFGHEWIVRSLVTGGIFDHGRLPILTLLIAAGVLLALRRDAEMPRRIALAGFVFWLALFFGRPTWGVLLRLAGIPADFQIHRLVGAVHFFGILLAAVSLDAFAARLRRLLPGRTRPLAAGALVLVLLPAAVERARFAGEGESWAEASQKAIGAERADLDAAISSLREREAADPGRIYPGLAAGWGKDFRTGDVPVYAHLSLARLDTLAFLFHAMSLPSDAMVLFDENRPVEYDVFDVRYVLMDASRTPPPFLAPSAAAGRFRIFTAPSSGRIGAGAIAFASAGGRDAFFGFASAWLKSDLPAAHRYGIMEAREEGGEAVPVLHPGDPVPAAAEAGAAPQAAVSDLRRLGSDSWEAEAEMGAPGVVFLKESFHPGWRVTIDGIAADPIMITPGFVGARIAQGRHHVAFRYAPGPLKGGLLLAGAAAFSALAAFGRRGRWPAMRAGVPVPVPEIDSMRRAGRALVLLTALVVALPLLQSKLLAGHDALEYPPRLVEFHENIAHGRLLPTWAPDLGNGFGQPLFLFSPPLFYVVAEIFHLAGAGLALSIELGTLVFLLVAGFGACLAGREAWGRRGGLVTGAAFLLSPYLLLDLFVRGNGAEFAGLALYPWAAWALLRPGRGQRLRGIAPLAAIVALVALCHLGAALILGLALIVMGALLAWLRRDPWAAARVVSALFLAVALAAFFVVPAAAHLGDVKTSLLRSGSLAYERHFVEPHQLVDSPWGYGLSVPGDADGMSLSVGLVHLFLGATAVVLLFLLGRGAHGDRRPHGAASLAGIFLAVAGLFALLTTTASAPIWDALPPLQYLAYPWRLLSIVSLCLSLAAGGIAAVSLPGGRRTTRTLGVLSILVLLAWGYPKARPSEYLTFDDAYYAPARIAALGINTTTREEYEPRWVTSRPPARDREIEIVSGKAFVLSKEGNAWRREYRIEVEREAALVMDLFYFPGWDARVDGDETKIGAREGDGRMRVTLPAGTHDLTLELRATGAQVLGRGISVLALLAVAGLALSSRRRREGST